MEHTKEYLCKCNNCGAIMWDENPSVGQEKFAVDPLAIHGMETGGEGERACPFCLTDGYLVNIESPPIAAVISIDGYWKDDKKEFCGYLVYALGDREEGIEDGQFFYHGLTEREVKDIIGSTDTEYEFVVTAYDVVKYVSVSPMNLKKESFLDADLGIIEKVGRELYDCIEVHPCIGLNSDNEPTMFYAKAKYFEQCDEDDKYLLCWSVFAHHGTEKLRQQNGSLVSLADCSGKTQAEALAAKLEKERLGRDVEYPVRAYALVREFIYGKDFAELDIFGNHITYLGVDEAERKKEREPIYTLIEVAEVSVYADRIECDEVDVPFYFGSNS